MPILPCPFPLAQVLACTDDSPASQGALKAALDLARACRSRVVLLHVLEFFPFLEYPQPDALGLPPPLAQDLLNLREKAAREQLEKWQKEAAEQGVTLEGRLQVGGPVYTEIMAAAEELKPDLIVMGRKGKSGIERLLVGSVTARVIGHTKIKVLVVPRDATLAFGKLLVTTDGSPASQAACREALNMAHKTGAQLAVVTVSHGDLDPKRAKELVRELASQARKLQVDLIPLTPQGRPEEVILQVAEHREPHLIILGSHGRTGLKRLLMGSVAERVIGQVACPVLVVK